MQRVAEQPTSRLVLFAVPVEIIDIEAAGIGDELGSFAGQCDIKVGLQVRSSYEVDIERGQGSSTLSHGEVRPAC